MSRRKRRMTPSNYMGNKSPITPSNGDMSNDEFLSMMEAINRDPRGHAVSKRSKKDVMITLNPLKDNRTPRISFRVYNAPKGMELKAGERVVLYPIFDDSRKRLYFVKNENGHMLSSTDNKSGTLLVQVTCNGPLAYFAEKFDSGVKYTEADWKFDNNVKLPYVEV